MDRLKKNKHLLIIYALGTMAYLFMYFTLFMSFQHEEYGVRQLPRLAFMLCTALCYIFLMLFCANDKWNNHIIRQLLTLNCFLSAILILSIPVFVQYLKDVDYFGVSGYVSSLIAVTVGVVFNARHYKGIINKKTIMSMAILCVTLVLCYLYTRNHFSYFLWDSHDMFELIDGADAYSLMNFVELSLSNHVSYSFSFFAVIFKFLFGSSVTAQTYIGYVLYIIGVIGFWKCVELFDKRENSFIVRLAVTAVWACSPYMLGMITYSYNDYAIWCLYPLIVYFLLSENYIYTFFLGTIFVFLKETALFFYVFLIVGYYLADAIKKKSIFSHLRRYIALAIPCIPWLISYCFVGHWDGSGSAAFNIGYLALKFRTYFFINFNWVLLVIVIFGIAVSLVRKMVSHDLYFELSVGSSAISYLLFSVVFVTVNHPRYIDAVVSALYLCAAYVIIHIINDNKYKVVLCALLAALMLAQSFFTIDPIMRQNFQAVEVGDAYVITTSEILSDGMAYNRQYQNWGKVIDLALRDIDKEGSNIYMAALYDDTWHFDAMGIYNQLNGETVVLTEAWDNYRQTRMTSHNEGSLAFDISLVSSDANIEIDDSRTGYYLYNDLAGEELSNVIKQKYRYEEQTFSVNGWNVKRIQFN